MIDPYEQLRTTLHTAGQSLTLPRRLVFKALSDMEPLTISELVSRCGTIDRASVYRTIRLFEVLHIVNRLQIGWKYKLELSDAFSGHHHHFVCTHCGRIIIMPEDILIERRLRTLAHVRQFDIRDHQVEIRGLCAACSKHT